MDWEDLSLIQKNILFSSIIADGEITKLYAKSRRINNSYREHFSIEQLEYRRWKANFLKELLYFRTNNTYLVSKSSPIFTSLYHYFYNQFGQKRIPTELLDYCILPHFLAVLYLDDGSLSISKRINHNKKLIYITPHIYLYLQNYPKEELIILQAHIQKIFGFNFKINSRPDGFGFVLKITKVEDTMKFLDLVSKVCLNLSDMNYKLDWNFRLEQEKKKYKHLIGYVILASDSNRNMNYSKEEIDKLINLKKNGRTDQEISIQLGRTYWSIVYKIRELRKDGHL